MDERYIVLVSANFILNVFWLIFMVATLKPRYGKVKTWLLLIPFMSIMFIVCFLTTFDQMVIRFATVLVVKVLCAIFIFKDKWPRVLLTIFLMYLIMAFSELVFTAIFPEAAKSREWLLSQSYITQINIYTFYLALNGALLFVAAIFLRKRSSHISVKEWLVISLFPISQLVLLIAIFYLLTNGVNGMLLYIMPPVVLTCLLADVAMFRTLFRIEQQMLLRLENQRLDRQIEAQKKYYSNLSTQYENIRFLQHDIANHMHTIQLLLESSKVDEAATYAKELLSDHSYRSTLGACDNPIVDAFLCDSIESASANGIEVRSEVYLPARINVANSDLISALGNLMDNAVEACTQLNGVQPFIRIKASMRPPYMFIETVNPMPETSERKRKSPEVARGAGNQILANIAKQYGGDYSTEIIDGCYRARLTLNTDTERQH